MTDEKKKMTAQGSSVGADDGQSISQITENSIPTSGQKSNDEIVNFLGNRVARCQIDIVIRADLSIIPKIEGSSYKNTVT